MVLLRSLSTGCLLCTTKAHDVAVLYFSIDSRTLLSSFKDRNAKLWQIVGSCPEQMALEH